MTMGGTSLAAPSWAALIAVADQGRVAEGGTTLDGGTQTLPALYSAALRRLPRHHQREQRHLQRRSRLRRGHRTGLRRWPTSWSPTWPSTGWPTTSSITAQPPASATAGSPFGLTVEVEGPDGSLAIRGERDPERSRWRTTPAAGAWAGPSPPRSTRASPLSPASSIDQAGTGYTLAVSGTGLGSATTSAFNVTPAAATKLVIAAQPPTSIAAGGPFGLTVDVEDAYGNLESGLFGQRDPLAGGRSGGGGARRDAQATATGGVATFSGLTIDQAGTGYTIEASAAGLTPATTRLVRRDARRALEARHRRAGPRSSVTAGARFGLTVAVEDAYGNLETGYGGEVTVGSGGRTGRGRPGRGRRPSRPSAAWRHSPGWRRPRRDPVTRSRRPAEA